MALLKILAFAILFACCQRVHVGANHECQLCISTPSDLTKKANDVFDNWNVLVEKKPSGSLCKNTTEIAKGIQNEDISVDIVVTAHLQVLVYNPYHCYFQFIFGDSTSPVNCLVSGYNISGGHFTEGHCTAVGIIPNGQYLTVKIGSAQGTYPCVLRGNNFLCLSASA